MLASRRRRYIKIETRYIKIETRYIRIEDESDEKKRWKEEDRIVAGQQVAPLLSLLAEGLAAAVVCHVLYIFWPAVVKPMHHISIRRC